MTSTRTLTPHEQRLVEDMRYSEDPFSTVTYAPAGYQAQCPRCSALVEVLFYVSGAHEHVCARCYDQAR